MSSKTVPHKANRATGASGRSMEGGPGWVDPRLSMISGTKRTMWKLKNAAKLKRLRKKLMEEENRNFQDKIDSMPNGLGRK